MARTLKKDIDAKVTKVDELKGSMSVLKACKAAKIAYPTYLKHRTGGVSKKSYSLGLYQQLVKAIRAEVLADLKAKLE